jgi:hypothetical protein
VESNTICFPSGDQCGDPVIPAPSEVSCTALDPSLSHTHTSTFPDRVVVNTILEPSGDNCGTSWDLLDLISGSGGPVAVCPFSSN